MNEYARALGADYERTPKAVLAAVAVSYASRGGDELEHARARVLAEWEVLHKNGIVPQAPPRTGAERSE